MRLSDMSKAEYRAYVIGFNRGFAMASARGNRVLLPRLEASFNEFEWEAYREGFDKGYSSVD